MTSVVFYFQVHQPYRVRRAPGADAAADPDPFDRPENQRILRKVADRCYLPMNELLLRLVERHQGRFRCSFSISGTALRQLEEWAPEALHGFQRLAASGCVEFLCETAYHSLAAFARPAEWEAQVRQQRRRVQELFGRKPVSFRNTELIIDNRLAQRVERLGFKTLLGEGADRLLRDRSPYSVYQPAGCKRLKLLLRAYRFSDDIAFRFSNTKWERHPLTAETFARWLAEVPPAAPFIGLFMDYETFGEHQSAATGIFDFMEHLPRCVLEQPGLRFQTPGEVAAERHEAAELDVPDPVSWADEERDLSAWLGNLMQHEAQRALYRLYPAAQRAARQGRPELLETWRRLSTSDHVYYMCTKSQSDGQVHSHFSPYGSPYDAYMTFMRVLDDFAAELAAGRRGRAASPRPAPAAAPPC